MADQSLPSCSECQTGNSNNKPSGFLVTAGVKILRLEATKPSVQLECLSDGESGSRWGQNCGQGQDTQVVGPGEGRGETAGGDCVPRLWEKGRQGQADVLGLNLAVSGEPLSSNRHACSDRALFFCRGWHQERGGTWKRAAEAHSKKQWWGEWESMAGRQGGGLCSQVSEVASATEWTGGRVRVGLHLQVEF